jgi:hypothetical protein
MSKPKTFFARCLFEKRLLQADGQAFEDLFCQLMRKRHEDFNQVKAYGRIGDMKNDGFLEEKGQFFALYGPEDISKQAAIDYAKNKIESDVSGLIEQWQGTYNIREVLFTVNDKGKGLAPQIYQCLPKLRKQFPTIQIKTFTYDNLIDEFNELSLEQMEQILGMPIPEDAVTQHELALNTVRVIQADITNKMRLGITEGSKQQLTLASTILEIQTDNQLLFECKVLEARLLSNHQNIPAAKEMYLSVLETGCDDVDAIMGYVSLCLQAPEDGDQADIYLQKARRLEPQHPKILLHDFKVSKPDGALPVDEVLWPEQLHLWRDFCLTHVLYFDEKGNIKKRDALLVEFEKRDPECPELYLLRLSFQLKTFYEAKSYTTTEIQNTLNIIKNTELSLEKSDRKLCIVNTLALAAHKIRVYSIAYQSAILIDSFVEGIDDFFTMFERCYFCTTVDNHLTNVLDCGFYKKTSSYWDLIVNKITSSKVRPSNSLLATLFLYGLNSKIKTEILTSFFDQYETTEQYSEIAKAIADEDKNQTVKRLYLLASEVQLAVLYSIKVSDFKNEILAEYSKSDFPYPNEIWGLQIQSAEQRQDQSEIDRLMSEADLKNAAPEFLRQRMLFAHKHDIHHVIINVGDAFLKQNNGSGFTTDAERLMAYHLFKLGDYYRALPFVEKSLAYTEQTDEKQNYVTLIQYQLECLCRTGQKDKLLTSIEKYFPLAVTLPYLGFQMADYLADLAQNPLEAQRAYTLIQHAFEALDPGENDKRLGHLFATSSLHKLNVHRIYTESLAQATKNTFVKISNNNTWFYLGNLNNPLGAICLEDTDERYIALINQAYNQEIDWPQDRVQYNASARHIERIVDYESFINIQAMEQLGRLVQRGENGCHLIEIPLDETVQAIEHAMKELKKRSPEVVMEELGKSTIFIPLSIVSKLFGSWFHALSAYKEFDKSVYLSDMNHSTIQNQYSRAEKVIQESPYTLDPFTAFLLHESNLLDVLIKNNNNLFITCSFLDELNRNLEVIKPNRASKISVCLKNESMVVHDIDHDSLEAKYNSLQDLNETLSNVQREYIVAYPEAVKQSFCQEILCPYVMDAYQSTLNKDGTFITDDFSSILILDSIYSKKVNHTSSISIARALLDVGLITWEQYLKHHETLVLWGLKGLVITSSDIGRCIMELNKQNLAIVRDPKTVQKLKLEILFDNKYGYDKSSIETVLSEALAAICVERSLVPEQAAEYFACLLTSLPNEWFTEKSFTSIFRKVQSLTRGTFETPSIEYKLEILWKQMHFLISDYDPVYRKAPALLASASKA